MKIGYQLFSAREKCKDAEGLKNVLQSLSQMGYDGVEFYTYADIPAEEMKRILAKLNLLPVNSHVQLDRWEWNLDQEIEYAREIGLKLLTIPYVMPEDRGPTYYEKMCESIPIWGRKCRENGIQLCYHNHDFEFEAYRDGILFDRILNADPKLRVELDVFWTFFSKRDPVAYMEQLHDRLELIHVKDYQDLEQKPFPLFAAVGSGKMDCFPAVLEKARTLGLEWVVVEQDNGLLDSLESARDSLAALKKML